ncbi:myoneurin-like isoform X3 [Varroa destructor]|uniref:C2H2-type domain-containing protein n=1 Tax=Varroa destructor TaxID=109461 RepID=A0A7M7JN95_VARDE|nr:myoneurin-like isoform X3 [Varroa destructor]XP_022653796.1 myoneurin-like isoform X3 [Varroa destructor]XP_022653797.1 myoneurin-like isoform X3 [Varroa destructor]
MVMLLPDIRRVSQVKRETTNKNVVLFPAIIKQLGDKSRLGPFAIFFQVFRYRKNCKAHPRTDRLRVADYLLIVKSFVLRIYVTIERLIVDLGSLLEQVGEFNMTTSDEPILITPDDSTIEIELVDSKAEPESGHRRRGVTSTSCFVCLRGNLRGAHLERHLRTHTKERPFQCPHCDYRASQKSTLYTHIALRHAAAQESLTEEQQRHFIESCSAMVSAAASSDDTTGGKQASRVDRWICAICSRRCPSAAHLRMHLRVHTKEKPYACEFCPYRATTKGNLKLHVGRLHATVLRSDEINHSASTAITTSASEDGISVRSNPILSNLLLPIPVPSELLEIAMTVKEDRSDDQQV